MRVLGIESSCDETAAAVVEDGRYLRSSLVRSQIDIHAAYGGVVPEIAARNHLEVVGPVVTQALREAQCDWSDIDAIAVTTMPGLSGSLLIGSLHARMLAILHDKPLIGVHHVEAHVYANFITEQAATSKLILPSRQPSFPLLALIVSGGHSQLVLFRGHGDYELLGQTHDDAIGEAFDKVAKILGLPYPGGPSIAAAAEAGDPAAHPFPIARLSQPYDFSFSGLKTAVLRTAQQIVGKDFTFPSHELSGLLTAKQRHDIAASFQHIAIKTLVDKTLAAYQQVRPASVVIAGGVAANQELRRQLQAALPLEVSYAPIQLCTDNAAMIASLGYFMAEQAISPYTASITPSISMRQTAWRS